MVSNHIILKSLAALVLTLTTSCKSRNFDANISSTKLPVLSEFNPNDIAILFPLPPGWDEYMRLLGLGWDGSEDESRKYTLLTSEHFQDILSQGFQSLSDQPDAGNYSRNDKTFSIINSYDSWRVVSMRYSPCAKANPKNANAACQAELRLVAQPVLEPKLPNTMGTTPTPGNLQQGTKFGRGLTDLNIPKPEALKAYNDDSFFLTEDQAIHMVYHLTQNDHKLLLEALWKLKKSSERIKITGDTSVAQIWGKNESDLSKVWVHPLLYISMNSKNLNKEIQDELRNAEDQFKFDLMKFARGSDHSQHGNSNLHQILFLGTGVRTSGTGWAFSGFNLIRKDTSSILQRTKLNTNPSPALLEAFQSNQAALEKAQFSQILVHENHAVSTSMTMPFQSPNTPEDIVSLSDRLGVLKDKEVEFINRSGKLFNPEEHGQTVRNCANCHISTSAFLNFQRRKVENIPKIISELIGSTAKANGFQSGEPWLGYATEGYYPLFYGFNLRQFGYYTRFASISIRTQIEAAADVRYLRSHSSELASKLNLTNVSHK